MGNAGFISPTVVPKSTLCRVPNSPLLMCLGLRPLPLLCLGLGLFSRVVLFSQPFCQRVFVDFAKSYSIDLGSVDLLAAGQVVLGLVTWLL